VVDAQHAWVATDTGMILNLVEESTKQSQAALVYPHFLNKDIAVSASKEGR
jgi:hypothetical protein